ncbi:MAG: glycosyltransferase [Roseiflexaceae bacterium]|jgi:GT2 family glycosyltransferase|nr:glycosyltransferase family 2 protein [Chloroflexaceae bacterium]
MTTTPHVAVIIPMFAGDTIPTALATSLACQTIQPHECVVVRGVSPNGRARNHGVSQSHAEWLLFVDDDAVLGHPDLIERLLLAAQHPTVGIVGSARILPLNATPFAQAVATQVARIVNPVVPNDCVTNPDAPHFYCNITTTCCLMHRSVFNQVGGFDETLTRGVDSEFFVRVRRMTARNIMQAGNTWVYHPAPATLSALWHKHVAYGRGHAQEVQRDRLRARGGNYFHTPIHALLWFAVRTILAPLHAFIPYSYGDPRWRIGFYPLKALASYASAVGYVIGWYRP